MLSLAQLKLIQSLKLKKYRQKYREFLIEGDKIVLEAITGNYPVRQIIATQDWIDINAAQLPAHIPIAEALPHQIKKISELTTPAQVIAVAAMQDTDITVIPQNGWILALDHIQDPGNLGTIIRTADWFGIHTILCSPGCVDSFNAKTIQSSMGSILRVQIMYTDLEKQIPELQLPVFAATLQGVNYSTVAYPTAGILLVGSESHGISPNLLALSNTKITIPRKGMAESLNAAVACSILLSEIIS